MLKLDEIFHNLASFDLVNLQDIVSILSKLEHEADLTKNDIRNHLPKSLFLAIDRSQLLEILAIQDSIADLTEEVGHLLTLKRLTPIDTLYEELQFFFKKNKDAFIEVYHIMKEMDNLLEASFGGIEAQKVKLMIDRTAYKEYESDLIKRRIIKLLFEKSTDLTPADFYQWIKIIEGVGEISHTSEKLAMRVRMLLDINN